MKHELLYETNDSFIQKEGNDDKVTSIVPGVAYIKDIEESKYNNSLGILTVFYDVADTSEATKIFTSDGIKNNLVEAVIEKNRISPSELTQEYQFAEAGKHAVRFIYSNLLEIPENAFSGCTCLYDFKLPKSITKFKSYCFYETGVINLVIPKQITSYSSGIFQNCQSLKNIVFSPSITDVKTGDAFTNCSNLQKIIFGNGIVSFGANTTAQRFCSDTIKLNTVIFPPTLAYLGGSYPFAAGTNTSCNIYFTSLEPPQLQSSISQNMFRNRRNIKIYVPEESLDVYKTATYFVNDASKIYPIPSDWDNPYE